MTSWCITANSKGTSQTRMGYEPIHKSSITRVKPGLGNTKRRGLVEVLQWSILAAVIENKMLVVSLHYKKVVIKTHNLRCEFQYKIALCRRGTLFSIDN